MPQPFDQEPGPEEFEQAFQRVLQETAGRPKPPTEDEFNQLLMRAVTSRRAQGPTPPPASQEDLSALMQEAPNIGAGPRMRGMGEAVRDTAPFVAGAAGLLVGGPVIGGIARTAGRLHRATPAVAKAGGLIGAEMLVDQLPQPYQSIVRILGGMGMLGKGGFLRRGAKGASSSPAARPVPISDAPARPQLDLTPSESVEHLRKLAPHNPRLRRGSEKWEQAMEKFYRARE